MQITYKKLDGTTAVYTANTAVTSNVIIGNAFPLSTWANRMAELAANATTIVSAPVQLYGRSNIGNVYYRQSTTYVHDYGLSAWAQERLSSTDYQTYETQSTFWSANITGNIADPNFATWWGKFVGDTGNVTVSNS
jgi:hypothetical protein